MLEMCAFGVTTSKSVDVVHAQTTCRLLVDILLMSSPDQLGVSEK